MAGVAADARSIQAQTSGASGSPIRTERASVALIRIADVLSLVVLLILAWAMIGQGLQAYDYGDRKLELALPLYVLWLFALGGMAGTIVCAAVATIWGRIALKGKTK